MSDKHTLATHRPVKRVDAADDPRALYPPHPAASLEFCDDGLPILDDAPVYDGETMTEAEFHAWVEDLHTAEALAAEMPHGDSSIKPLVEPHDADGWAWDPKPIFDPSEPNQPSNLPPDAAVLWIYNKYGQRVTYTLVDKEFINEPGILNRRWYIDRQKSTTPYVARTDVVTDANGNRRNKTVRLHQLIKELRTRKNKKAIPPSHMQQQDLLDDSKVAASPQNTEKTYATPRVIHHKNNNGLDNRSSNLEWRSLSYNRKKAKEREHALNVKLLKGPLDNTWSVVTFNRFSDWFSYPLWHLTNFDIKDELEAKYLHDRLALELYGADKAKLFDEELRACFADHEHLDLPRPATIIDDLDELEDKIPGLEPRWHRPHKTYRCNGENRLHSADILDYWEDYRHGTLLERAAADAQYLDEIGF